MIGKMHSLNVILMVVVVVQKVSFINPLNRFSFFKELEDKMLVPMQLPFNVEVNDDELIHMANGTDDGRTVITEVDLWVPKLLNS